MKNITKYTGFLFAFLLCFAATTCSDELYDPNPNEKYRVRVENITMILNKHGGDEYIGKINENKKDIHFRKLDPETDLSSVTFIGDLPRGAKFDSETYDFTVEEGATQITKVIKIRNGDRFRDYFVTIRLNTPPPGADFNRAKVYNFSQSGTLYNEYDPSLHARPADMDLNHVLIPGRIRDASGNPVPQLPHLLRLEDLKKGIIDPIYLNIGSVTGGTFPINSGRIVNGHVYLCNLSGMTPASPFKVYHWSAANADTPPDVVASFSAGDVTGIPDGVNMAARFGDYASVEINSRGSGSIFVKGWENSYHAMKIGVTGFVNSAKPAYMLTPEDPNSTAVHPNRSFWYSWPVFAQVEGQSDEFLVSGWGQASGRTALIDGNGKLLYFMRTFIVSTGNSARILNFNGMRYLITLDGARLTVYALRLGETTEEALKIFDGCQEDQDGNYTFTPDVMYQTPAYTASLGSFSYAATNSAVHVGFAKDDDTLYIIGSAAGIGFLIVEAQKTEMPDPEDKSDDFFDELDEKGYI